MMSVASVKAVDIMRCPISESIGGIASCVWTDCERLVAKVDADDFENFGLIRSTDVDARELAKQCVSKEWSNEKLEAYRTEIDYQVGSSEWTALQDLLRVD
jgi:hypothetical protein